MKYKGDSQVKWKGRDGIPYKGANPSFPNKEN